MVLSIILSILLPSILPLYNPYVIIPVYISNVLHRDISNRIHYSKHRDK